MKRIAFLGRGGHTLPTYRALLNELSSFHQITVYSEVPVETEWSNLHHRYILRPPLFSRRLNRRVREIIFLLTVIRDHLKEPFHLVHAHSTYPTGFAAVVLQMLFGVPAFVSLHAAEASGFPDIDFGDLLHRKRTLVNRWVIQRARVVTALSHFQRNEVVMNLGIRRPINVIYRGVDSKNFQWNGPASVAAPVVFLAVGYLNDIKDPETLLRTFAFIGSKIDSILVVVGRDYTNGGVRSLAIELGLENKVKFEGWVDHEKINQYYREADVLLHTSRYESQGMVVAEAMACGLLVAGTHVGLMSDLAGACCITAPPQDPQALAEAVLALLNNPSRMETIRRNARSWSERHSLKNCVSEISALYESVMKQ